MCCACQRANSIVQVRKSMFIVVSKYTTKIASCWMYIGICSYYIQTCCSIMCAHDLDIVRQREIEKSCTLTGCVWSCVSTTSVLRCVLSECRRLPLFGTNCLSFRSHHRSLTCNGVELCVCLYAMLYFASWVSVCVWVYVCEMAVCLRKRYLWYVLLFFPLYWSHPTSEKDQPNSHFDSKFCLKQQRKNKNLKKRKKQENSIKMLCILLW